MNRIDRLVATVLLLHSKRLIRAEDVAHHFGISLRTVYRDMRALDEAGVPIAAEAGEGYRLASGYHLPPVMFTEDEAGALFVGAEFAKHLTDNSLGHHAESALLKIRSVLTAEKKDYIERLQAATSIHLPPRAERPEFRNDVLAAIQNAIVNRHPVTMEYYTNSRDTFSKRTTEPLGLVYYSSHWHLIAYCRTRKDVRDFRTDRIKSLSLHSTEQFSERKDFSLKTYLNQSERLERVLEVCVKFSPRAAAAVRERYALGLVAEQTTDSGVVMTFLVPSEQILVNWLLSFGTQVQIISPGTLRQAVQTELAALMQHHNA
jgi:predicted DNA-binding transcriptional regulator YafY